VQVSIQTIIRNAIRGQRVRSEQTGFSLVGILLVVIISLILAAIAIPTLSTANRLALLRGAASDYSGLLEQARIYAIRDNKYYAINILTPAGSDPVAQGYVDLTKNGGTAVVTGDPSIYPSSLLAHHRGGPPLAGRLGLPK
jgi:type II secretory pathway pseudopilin PulG